MNTKRSLGPNCMLARIAFLTLPLVCIRTAEGQVLPAAAHAWDASHDLNNDGKWNDMGVPGGLDWVLSGPDGANSAGPARIPVSSSTVITHAFEFDGVDDAGFAASENRAGNHDTTFEFWFRPASTVPTGMATIFEHGNSPRGVTLGISGDTVRFIYGSNPDSALLSFDLDVNDDGLDRLDFTQVIGVVDDTRDQLRMYVNGANEQSISLATGANDFTSNDDLGLGQNQGLGGGGQAGSGFTPTISFAGQIAVIREYRTAFGAAEAQQSFSAMMVPEPVSGVSIWGTVVALVVGWRNRSNVSG